jgi:hypothetical protein
LRTIVFSHLAAFIALPAFAQKASPRPVVIEAARFGAKLDDVTLYANDAFSVLAQQTENITVNRCFGGPRPASGRTASSWADIFHFTLCTR